MQRILAISGKKQSGKTSASNFIHGWEMRRNGVIEYFDISPETGDLIVNTVYLDAQGNSQTGYGILDLKRNDYDFFDYASRNIYPFVKGYSFAFNLKMAIMKLFGVSYEQLNGTDLQKNTATTIKFSDISFFLAKDIVKRIKEAGRFNEYLTGREIMQYFGTDICRKIQPGCHAKSCVRDIKDEAVPFAINADTRYPDEVEEIQNAGGRVLRLLYAPFASELNPHESETALDEYPLGKFDAVIDNANMTIKEKNVALFEVLSKWGWLSGQLSAE